jgi:predicted Zn-dependent protease
MRCLPLILVATLSMACVQTVEVSRMIQPSRSNPERSSEKAGVVCRENLLDHVVRGSYYERSYELRLGEPLCNALLHSVEGTYRSAQRSANPYKGEYGRVVKFDVLSSTLDVQKKDGVTRVACSISVVVERFGRDLQRQSSQGVIGNGFVERRDATDVVVREAVEAALQQVADNASILLVAGIDGPRVTPPPPR